MNPTGTTELPYPARALDEDRTRYLLCTKEARYLQRFKGMLKLLMEPPDGLEPTSSYLQGRALPR